MYFLHAFARPKGSHLKTGGVIVYASRTAHVLTSGLIIHVKNNSAFAMHIVADL